MTLRLFAVPEPKAQPQHYSRLLRATGLRYGHLSPDQRVRLGKLANRLANHGVTERRITEEGERLRIVLGRWATPAEIARRLLQ